jgi:hypothetical protein
MQSQTSFPIINPFKKNPAPYLKHKNAPEILDLKEICGIIILEILAFGM